MHVLASITHKGSFPATGASYEPSYLSRYSIQEDTGTFSFQVDTHTYRHGIFVASGQDCEDCKVEVTVPLGRLAIPGNMRALSYNLCRKTASSSSLFSERAEMN